MELREVDDTGWDELPGGLAFTEGDEPLAPPSHPTAVRVLSWLVVLALLGGGAFFGLRWWSERDVREVLASTASTYRAALGELAAARDPEALATAAGAVDDQARTLESQLDRLDSRRGATRAAVVAQVEAERDVLLALAPLERLAEGPLGVWGEASADADAAVERERRTRSALRQVDAGAAARLPDTGTAVRRVAATVGAALVADVQRTAGELLDALDAAERTSDLRAAAERATAQREAVESAQTGLGPSTEADVLGRFAAALDAVRGLADLTPAQTTAWPDVRARLSENLRAVADSDDSLAAGSVRARLPLVLESVDDVVARAAEAQAAWQPVFDAAVAQQATDRAALQRYAEQVRATAVEWAQVRADTSSLLTSQGGSARADARFALLPVASAADRIVTGLRAAPPAGTESAHAALLAAGEPLAGALTAAVFDLGADACPECPAADSASWAAVDAAAGRSGWEALLPAWESAVTAADAAVAARALPPPPDA